MAQDPWDTQTELLAQLLEVMSVMAADKALRKPVQVPRPAHLRGKGPRDDDGNVVHLDAYKQGIAVLARTARPIRAPGQSVTPT